MMNMKYLTCILLLVFASGLNPCLSQDGGRPYGSTDFSIEVFGSAASGGYTPFWIVGNRYGAVPLEAGNGYLRVGTFHRQSAGNVRWGAGLDVIASTPRYRHAYVQQIYAEVGYKCLTLTIGSKENYTSLWDKNLSSGDMVFSANARPMPEINIYTPAFTTVPGLNGVVQFRGNFAVGRSFDTDYLRQWTNGRFHYIENVLWHHKSLHLRFLDPHGGFPLTATVGVRHHAQWGGVSTNPAEGVQPHSLKDFVRIIMGSSGGDDASLSAQKNVLGNHYGSFDLKFGYLTSRFDVHLYKQHFFDDMSGIELHNLPDGLYGVQVGVPDCSLVSKVVFEYMYTKNQSGPAHYITYDHSIYPGYGGGRDQYYNSEEYTTGVSYFNRSIGSPLIASPEYNEDRRVGFRNNRIRAWHVGIDGYLSRQVAYRVLATGSEGWGTAERPFLKKTGDFSCAARVSYCHPRLGGWLFSGEIGIDRGSLYGNSRGVAISVSKTGFIGSL